jgi:anti-sigma B factor antagonist
MCKVRSHASPMSEEDYSRRSEHARIIDVKVDVRRVDDVIIVDLEGRLVLGVGDEILRDVINELLAEDWKKILLNLREIRIMDSSGIGEVLSSWKLAKRFGASVKLLRPGPHIQRTLRLTQLLPLLEVYEDEAEAVASFVTN